MTALAEFIEREAGHVCVLLLLVALGIVLVANGWNNGGMVLDGAFGALLYSMRGRKTEPKP